MSDTLQTLLAEFDPALPLERAKTIPNTWYTSPEIARLEQNTPGLGTPDGYKQIQPLTREAAELLLGEPELGREVEPENAADPHTPAVGQRFYFLEIRFVQNILRRHFLKM